MIKFTKMHGIGNDYVFINCFKQDIENPGELSRNISNRNFGIGSDGLILILPSKIADAKMKIFNSDGSPAEMCGNGIRCVAKYLFDNNICRKSKIKIDTECGIKSINIYPSGKEFLATVNMGTPTFSAVSMGIRTDLNVIYNFPLKIEDIEILITCVSIGNPHTIVFVNDLENTHLEKIALAIQSNQMFWNSTNVEFVKIIDRFSFEMRVFERGSLETLACGTGACAAAYTAIKHNLIENEVIAKLKGGNLSVMYSPKSDTIFLTGSATTVFEGEISI